MDRNNKATLPRTAPSTVFKSSAKDLNLPSLKLYIQSDFQLKEKIVILLNRSTPKKNSMMHE